MVSLFAPPTPLILDGLLSVMATNVIPFAAEKGLIANRRRFTVFLAPNLRSKTQ